MITLRFEYYSNHHLKSNKISDVHFLNILTMRKGKTVFTVLPFLMVKINAHMEPHQCVFPVIVSLRIYDLSLGWLEYSL